MEYEYDGADSAVFTITHVFSMVGGKKDSQHGDGSEILWHEKPGEHKVRQEVYGQRPHFPDASPHHAGNGFFFQITLFHTILL